MLKVHTLTVGLYQTNCYIVHQKDSDRCCIIDPGYEPETILDFLEEHKLTPAAILLTHGHFDHVGAVRTVAAEYRRLPVYLCTEDLIMPPQMTAGPIYHTDGYRDGSVLDLADIHWEVLHTPGQTPGSVCLIAENCMFSGDTLFQGSCGRTDLPCGSFADLKNSLHRLSLLNTNYLVFPGHGDSTTLEEEKRYNPYLK